MALGRGLSSLIQQKNQNNRSEKTIQAHSKGDAVLEVDIESIIPNPYQPRKKFKDDALQDLAESIKQHGILQPIVVVSAGDKYQIIAGERRFRASKIAGLKKVPVILKDDKSEKEQLELAILENIQREDLTPLERALSYKQLSEEFGMTHAQIGERVGKGRVAISNTIRLLDLPDSAKEALEKGEISENHARAILSLPEGSMRERLLAEIKTQKLSARNSEVAARAMLKRPVKSLASLDSELKGYVSDMEKSLGTKVVIKPKKHVSDGGEIVVRYFSNEDLKRIVKKISKS